MAALKTYSFIAWHPDIDPERSWVNQAHATVAARSRAEVMRLLADSDGRIARSSDVLNLSETANLADMVLSLGAPGIVFHSNMHGRSTDYRPAGGYQLGIAPTDPDVLIADHEKRYPTSHLNKQAREALPAIRSAWDAARLLWPDADFAR
jgi:hypothetical protein